MNSFWTFWFSRMFSSYGNALFRISMPWLALKIGGPPLVALVVTVAIGTKALGSYLMGPLVEKNW